MKRLCTICARAGSKGVPNKNLRPLNGVPLINRTVQQARESGLFSGIAVSSDSKEILKAAMDAGADLLVDRPAELATDRADKSPAIVHCARQAEKLMGLRFDTFTDLDVTAPFRTSDDIAGAIALLEQTGAKNVFSAAPSRRSPYFNMVETVENGSAHLVKPLKETVLRRQDAPKTYDMNASIYVWRRDVFFPAAPIFTDDVRVFIMPEERSLDIDSEFDWLIATLLAKQEEVGE
ncbi:acylneuraminate cytidylyltransferase family protein [Alphaproteobacteria bacterium]|nr:acylneuraminate cytidylyltransferase family protein [Alphaproteobacteria bacterium]